MTFAHTQAHSKQAFQQINILLNRTISISMAKCSLDFLWDFWREFRWQMPMFSFVWCVQAFGSSQLAQTGAFRKQISKLFLVEFLNKTCIEDHCITTTIRNYFPESNTLEIDADFHSKNRTKFDENVSASKISFEKPKRNWNEPHRCSVKRS